MKIVVFVVALMVAALTFCGAASAQQSLGPSFDCTKAKDTLAILICSDSGLSRTDLAFVQAYQALRQQSDEQGQHDLRQQAIDFQTGVYQSCDLPRATAQSPIPRSAIPCVGQAYAKQRSAWLARLEGPAAEEAARSLERHVALQRDLQLLGFMSSSTPVDGVYGPMVRNAISIWQGNQAMAVTGFLGDNDARALERSIDDAARAGREREDRARLEADKAAEGQARREALVQLAAALAVPPDVATIFARLGSPDNRMRKSLKGDFVLQDPTQMARGCMVVSSASDSVFIAAVISKVAGKFVGDPAPTSMRPCTVSNLQQSDLVLLYDPAQSLIDRSAADALTNFVRGPASEQLGHYSVGEWQIVMAAERRAVAEQVRLGEQTASSVRAEALDGSLQDWGGVQLPETTGEVACVVAPGNPGWINVLRSVLPLTARTDRSKVLTDPDADKQFGRFLAAECTVIIARGANLGDILRGLESNRRAANVLPIRLEQARLESLLNSKPPPNTDGLSAPRGTAPAQEVVPKSIQ